MATKAPRERDWTQKKAEELATSAAEPNAKFMHPSKVGFGVRKNKTGGVFFYRFRDKFGEEQSDTLGWVGDKTGGKFVTLADALAAYNRAYTYHTTKEHKGALTLAAGYEIYTTKKTKKGGSPLSPRTLRDYEGVYRRLGHGGLPCRASTRRLEGLCRTDCAQRLRLGDTERAQGKASRQHTLLCSRPGTAIRNT